MEDPDDRPDLKGRGEVVGPPQALTDHQAAGVLLQYAVTAMTFRPDGKTPAAGSAGPLGSGTSPTADRSAHRSPG